MRKRLLICCLALTMGSLSACATASRGSSTNLIVNTDPIGAKATTYLVKDKPRGLSRDDILKIRAGLETEPKYKQQFCDPTPCGIELPRKSTLPILITKKGYLPQIVMISHIHRKEMQKITARNTGIATVASGVTGGGIAYGFGSMFGATASAGTVATGVVVFAIPAVGIGLISAGVDSNTGANFDLYPNPVQVQLYPMPPGEEGRKQEQAIRAQYRKLRREALITLPPAPVSREQRIRDLQSERTMTQNERIARDKKRAEVQAKKDAKRTQELIAQCKTNGC